MYVYVLFFFFSFFLFLHFFFSLTFVILSVSLLYLFNHLPLYISVAGLHEETDLPSSSEMEPLRDGMSRVNLQTLPSQRVRRNWLPTSGNSQRPGLTTANRQDIKLV